MSARAMGSIAIALAIACAACGGSSDDSGIDPNTCGDPPAGACTPEQCDSNMPDDPGYPGCPGGAVYVCKPTGWAVDRPCVTYVVQVDGAWHLDQTVSSPCANLTVPASLDVSAALGSDPTMIEVTGASGMFMNEAVNIRNDQADVSFDLYDTWSDGATGTRDVRALYALVFDGRAGTITGHADGITQTGATCGFRINVAGTFTPHFAPGEPAM